MFIVSNTSCNNCGNTIVAFTVDAVNDPVKGIICATCATIDTNAPISSSPISAVTSTKNVTYDSQYRQWQCLLDGRTFNGPSKFAISQHYRHAHGGKQNIVEGTRRAIEQSLVNVVRKIATPDAVEITGVQQAAADATAGAPSRDLFTDFGNEMYRVIETGMHATPSVPIGLIGKSTIVDMIAETDPWNGRYAIQACHRGMDINAFVGGMYPVPDPNVLVEWHDGKLTKMAREGGIYHIEEMANADPDVLSRLHQVMDEGARRFLDLPESLEGDIDISPIFKYVASWNPPAKNYTSNKIPMPVMRRFGFIFTLDQTVVNEPKLLSLYMPEETARRCMALVVELRQNVDTWVCSRDVKLWGQAIANGFSPMDAVKYSLLPKFTASTDVSSTVMTMARSHFAPNTMAPSSMPSQSEY